MSIWQTVTWDVARAGGFTAYTLLTLSVAIGLALTLHWQTPRWPRLINSELHNFITLLALIFTGVHVLAVWLDPFTSFGWNEVFIPFASHYRPLWMAFGIVALYLGLAIGLSTWLRPYIGYKWWRRLHVLTLLLFALVAVHGIATGSDTRTWWGALLYASSILLVGILLWLRLYEPANAQSKAHPGLAMGMLVLVVAGAVWALLGPFQAGWNVVANNGQGSGASSAVQGSVGTRSAAQSGQPAQTVFAPSFSGNVQGMMTQRGPDSNGNVTLRLNMTITNGPQGTVQVLLGGQVVDNAGNISVRSSRVTLSSADGTQVYTGVLTNLTAQGQWDMTALLHAVGSNGSSNQQLQVHMLIQIDNAGQSTGTISGSTGSGGVVNN